MAGSVTGSAFAFAAPTVLEEAVQRLAECEKKLFKCEKKLALYKQRLAMYGKRLSAYREKYRKKGKRGGARERIGGLLQFLKRNKKWTEITNWFDDSESVL
jgi:flagellar biosynthesis chaperone FliJ